MCGVVEGKWLRVGTSAHMRGERLTGVLHDVKTVSDDPPPVGVLQLPIGDCNHNSIAPPVASFWGPLRLPLHLCSARRGQREREEGREGERLEVAFGNHCVGGNTAGRAWPTCSRAPSVRTCSKREDADLDQRA